MNKLTLEAAVGVYSGTAHDTGPYPTNIERNKAFKDGAEWQRNRVWNKATEMPKKGERILVCCSSGNMTSWYTTANVEEVFKRFNVKLWAYAKDILPDSFDGMTTTEHEAISSEPNEQKGVL